MITQNALDAVKPRSMPFEDKALDLVVFNDSMAAQSIFRISAVIGSDRMAIAAIFRRCS
jgi:hypothetical protein